MITLIAVLCRLAAPTDCIEKLVATSDTDPTLSIVACQMGEPRLIEWAKSFPAYQFSRWKCVIGKPAIHA